MTSGVCSHTLEGCRRNTQHPTERACHARSVGSRVPLRGFSSGLFAVMLPAPPC
jgi:hypothetical protein